MPDVVFLFETSAKVPFVFTEEDKKNIEEAAAGRVFCFPDEDSLLESGVEAPVLFTWCGTPPVPERYCEKAASHGTLKWVQSFSAGMNPVDASPVLRNLPVLYTNASGIHGDTIGEHVLGMILAYNRTLPFFWGKQREHQWAKGATRQPYEAAGRTLGVVGAGSIGNKVAEKAKALGMKTIGLRRHPKEEPCYDKVVGSDGLYGLLEESDYVVLATPLTASTFHMIDGEALAHMKKTALLVNIARGAVVDEQALIAALRANEIGGAALDVTEEEPLSPQSPLWDMENVMITPHMSADGEHLASRAVALFCENLRRYRAGESLRNVQQFR